MTLGQAFDRYESHLRDEYGVPDGRLKPWGKTKIDNVSSIRSYLSHEKTAKCNYLELDLGQLTLTVCDDIYRVIRSRPYSIRTGFAERLTLSSAGNLKKELTCFFDWIDGTDEIDWYLPRRFNSIKKKRIDKLTPQEDYERDLARESRVIPHQQLVTLYEYAIPEERILMLLGLNCAFGAAEIGQLRGGFLKFATNQIDGIRFKSGGKTKHQLWAATRDGLQWWLKQREQITPLSPADADVVFLTATGKPLWKNTSEGNASNGIANRWYRLLDRVQKDIPDFPRPSFNKLRKTAATRLLSIASAEVASMILAHKTISDDELLHHYVNLDWKKLFDAQLVFEEQMQEMFEAGGDAPWEPRPKSYIGLAKGRQILELHREGISAKEIAERLDVNKATVYRYISAEIGPRRSGRRASNN